MYGITIRNHPSNPKIENAHHGVHFDYYFMGKSLGGNRSRIVDLLLHIEIYDHLENKFIRKEACHLERIKVRNHIKDRIRNFMYDLGIDQVITNGLLRDFEVLNEKCQAWDVLPFEKF